MKTCKFILSPCAPLGTPLKGDTLFGQLCWAIHHRFGEARLNELLQGYTEGRPFAVVSDAFPAGFLPRPALPLHRFRTDEADRKRVKKRRWIPIEHLDEPLTTWLNHALSDPELPRRCSAEGGDWQQQRIQPHNTINRMTGTTGEGEFAPYGMGQTWLLPGFHLEIYLAFDPERIEADELTAAIRDIGHTGFGRDASIGLGKFEVVAANDAPWPQATDADAWLTLAPCAPQGLGFKSGWYQPFTRFGRHGDLAVHSGRPFKNPILLADTAALFRPARLQSTRFIGQGLGGQERLSKAIPGTVHQGYTPVLPVRLEEKA